MKMFRMFKKDERGSALAEFVLVVPVFLMFFFWVFEIGILLTRWAMLERGLDLTIRDLRLNEVRDPSGNIVDLSTLTNEEVHDLLSESVCANSSVLKDCNDGLLYLELTPVDASSSNIPSDGAECVNRTAPASTRPVVDTGTGADWELIYVRACYWVDPVLPLSLRILGIRSEVGTTTGPATDTNTVYKQGFAITAKSAYINEPT